MANYDIIITGAKAFHRNLIDNKTRLALLIYAKAIEFKGTTDFTTTAGQKTIVALAVKALAGIPFTETETLVPPSELAVWFNFAVAADPVAANATLNSKLAAIPYLLSLDKEVLAKTNIYLTGVILSVLT